MSKTVIHIGYHKTASTFLQNNLFPYIDVNYAFMANRNRDILNNIETKDFKIELHNEYMNELFGEKKYNVDLISHEALSGFPDGKRPEASFIIADNLKKIYPDAKILIVLRNQFDYILSFYTYRVAVKGEEYRSFKIFLKKAEKKGLFKKMIYHELVDYYIKLFGHENILLIPMEVLRSDENTFLKDITNFIGVPLPKIISNTPRNVSTKKIAVLKFWIPFNFLFTFIFKRPLDLFKKESKDPGKRIRYFYYKIKERMTKSLNNIVKNKHDLDFKNYSVYKELYDLFAKSNFKLQKQMKYNLKDLNYPF